MPTTRLKPVDTCSIASDSAAGSPLARPLPQPDVQTLDTRAPRYTSFPTADRFIEAFGADDYARHLSSRDLTHAGPLSIYVHIPFCESLCYYCACNKTITSQRGKAERYLDHLIAETHLTTQVLDGDTSVSQMHWGGGTPTFLSTAQIRRLMSALKSHFDFRRNGEYSIEIDPRAVDDEKIELLAAEGFNRMSLGVQDFDEAVQKAVNRVQPEALTREVLTKARLAGFQSTNFDLIYGLPRQRVETFTRTLESVVEMRPERIALYNYAHLPARFKAQRLIDVSTLPSAEEKLAIFAMANEFLDAAGYEYIGMDHFALPDDELAVANRTGRLHRNFQGYSTQPDCDLVALGASAISRIGTCYAQNVRGVNDYGDRIEQGMLATQRGFELSADDVLRRSIIMALMCQGYLHKDTFEVTHLIDFDRYFSKELASLEQYVAHGFVELSDEAIEVTESGRRKALRAIGAVFDPYFQQSRERSRYSRVL